MLQRLEEIENELEGRIDVLEEEQLQSAEVIDQILEQLLETKSMVESLIELLILRDVISEGELSELAQANMDQMYANFQSNAISGL